MNSVKQSALSLKKVRIQVTATASGVVVNPTPDTIQFAFMIGDAQPGGGDIVSGNWETWPNNVHVAVCLVGPGGTITLTPGTYNIWLKIIDSPEIPFEVVGQLVIY